jgi:curved DNA-binding protein CbpA
VLVSPLMKEPRDAYKVLQVDHEADLEVIQAAYRRLAQKYHPDRAASGPDADTAAQRMVEINAAWEQIRDVARRSAYDRRRNLRPAASPPSPASAPPSASRYAAEVAVSAGPPPGRPSGSVLNFGRYSGWSLGEIGRIDPGYLQWLDRTPIGRPYRTELDVLLRKLGMRLDEKAEAEERHGLFRRR